MTAKWRWTGRAVAVAGLLVVALFLADFVVNIAGFPGFSAAEQLAAFRSDKSWFFVAELALFLLLPLAAIPFSLGLRKFLRSSGSKASTIGAALFVAAFAVEAVQSAILFVNMGPLAEDYATGTQSERDAALVAATALRITTGGLFAIGMIALLVGVASFGYVQRKAPQFRKWVGYLGIANVVAIAPLMAGLFFVFFLLLLILPTAWTVVTAALLWRAPVPQESAGS